MIKLFSFWRSLATYRVRIALNLKGLTPDEEIDVNLMKGAQREAAYRAVNPMMALPALIDGEGPILFESLAIIEYLDETRPNPPLLPRDARGRARVRGLAQIVACDSHPLIVPRVREYLATKSSVAALVDCDDVQRQAKNDQSWSVSLSAQVRGGVSRPYSPGRRESWPSSFA